jgi:hypothetical protein
MTEQEVFLRIHEISESDAEMAGGSPPGPRRRTIWPCESFRDVLGSSPARNTRWRTPRHRVPRGRRGSGPESGPMSSSS